jgi:hypothetical protein
MGSVKVKTVAPMKTLLLPMLMLLIPVTALAAPDQAPVPPVAPAATVERQPADSPRDPIPGSVRLGLPPTRWQDSDQRHDLPYGAGYEARQRGFGAGWGGGRGFGRGRR